MQIQKYRKTELGEIPVDWKIMTIGSFLSINMGQSPPSETYNIKKIGLPFYQGVSDFQETHPTVTVWCSNHKKIANENEILFSVRAPVGEINLTKEKCCIGRGVASLIPVNSDLRYCFHLLKYFKNKFSTYSQGSTFESINRNQITNTKVPYTSGIKEQRKIASILSNIDDLIQKTDQIIEQNLRLKSGLMQRLLTKGIGHTKFKKTKLGEIPEDWTLEKLTNICHKITDGTHFTPKYTTHGIPFLRIIDIQQSEIDWNKTKRITMQEHEVLTKRCKPELGDVLLSKNGTIGITKVVNWNNPFSIFVSLCLIKPIHEKLNNHYLKYILPSEICLSQIRKRSKQGTITNLHLEEIRDFLIPIPSLKEQQKIVSILSNVDDLIRKLQNKKNNDKKPKEQVG